MSDPINRTGLRPRFWLTTPLNRMSPKEWEALCDGCGKCCMNKLEDEDTGEVELTNIACRLFDDGSCHCSQYEIRHQFVPECISLTPENLEQNHYWMPETCAYKLLYMGKSLPKWHPLVSKDPQSVYDAGVSMRERTIPEFEINEDDWDDYIIEEPV